MGSIVRFLVATWGSIPSVNVALVAMDMMAEVFRGEDISVIL